MVADKWWDEIESRPARGAWVEMTTDDPENGLRIVAPRKGRVG